jgi:hypothetical protein
MMFVRNGQVNWHHATLFAADRTEKHLLMRLAARFVERRSYHMMERLVHPTNLVRR